MIVPTPSALVSRIFERTCLQRGHFTNSKIPIDSAKSKEYLAPRANNKKGAQQMTKTATRTYKRGTPIDRAAFVKAWQKAETVGDVSEALKITAARASAQARFLRAKGVKLKSFRNHSEVDVKALNALIA